MSKDNTELRDLVQQAHKEMLARYPSEAGKLIDKEFAEIRKQTRKDYFRQSNRPEFTDNVHRRFVERSIKSARAQIASRYPRPDLADQRTRAWKQRRERTIDQFALDNAPFTPGERDIALRLAKQCGLNGKIETYRSHKCEGGAVSGPFLYHEEQLPEGERKGPKGSLDIRRTWIELVDHRQWLKVFQRYYASDKRNSWAHTVGVVPGKKPDSWLVCMMDEQHVVLWKRIRDYPVLVEKKASRKSGENLKIRGLRWWKRPKGGAQ